MSSKPGQLPTFIDILGRKLDTIDEVKDTPGDYRFNSLILNCLSSPFEMIEICLKEKLAGYATERAQASLGFMNLKTHIYIYIIDTRG